MIPKFRAWDVHNKKMLTESELVIWSGNVYANDYQKIFKRFMEGARGLVGYSVDDKYLMQSTGKMDSTGQVEVYAGDILYYPDQDEDNYGIIKFDEDTLAFVLDNGYERFVYGDYGMGKVIGNIYENPELVEGING
ncbi:TPA: YopX family protein [Streptococcus suis]